MDNQQSDERSSFLERENATLRAELSYADLEEASKEHRNRIAWALDTIRASFADHSDFVPHITQMTRSRALVTLANVATGEVSIFVLQRDQPGRMMTMLDFVWAAFMERTTEKAQNYLDTLPVFSAFCAQQVRFTEGADYDADCRLHMEDE